MIVLHAFSCFRAVPYLHGPSSSGASYNLVNIKWFLACLNAFAYQSEHKLARKRFKEEIIFETIIISWIQDCLCSLINSSGCLVIQLINSFLPYKYFVSIPWLLNNNIVIIIHGLLQISPCLCLSWSHLQIKLLSLL